MSCTSSRSGSLSDSIRSNHRCRWQLIPLVLASVAEAIHRGDSCPLLSPPLYYPPLAINRWCLTKLLINLCLPQWLVIWALGMHSPAVVFLLTSFVLPFNKLITNAHLPFCLESGHGKFLKYQPARSCFVLRTYVPFS